MVESSFCPTCSSPVLPGQAYCPTCGTPLPSGAALKATPADSGPAPADVPAISDPVDFAAEDAAAGTPDDPRLAALGLSAEAPPHSAPVAAPEPSEDPAERIPGDNAPPIVDPGASAWTLRPSSVSSVAKPAGPGIGLSLGAIRASSAGLGDPSADEAPAPPPADSSAIWPPAQSAPFAPASAPFAQSGPISPNSPFAQSGPFAQPAPPAPFPASFGAPGVRAAPEAFPASTSRAPAPVPAAAGDAASPTSDIPIRKESTQELVSFGLVAAGAALGIASLFLPWANGNGIGIGNYQSGNAPPNQWGWGAPAAIPLFLIGALALGAVAGSDRAQVRFPDFASVIRQVTDLIMPMVLGGLYAGVFLLYVTLPNGYGVGAFFLFVAACLLIAGAVITLFFPPEVAASPDKDGAVEPDEAQIDR